MMISRAIPRRHFLVSTGGTAGAIASLGIISPRFAFAQTGSVSKSGEKLPSYADWKNADAVIVHSQNTIETKRDAFGTSGITPNDRVYVRNNLPPPSPATIGNPDSWELSVAGVRNPRTLTVSQLKQLGTETVVTVLQCSGNGRAFFDHDASGTKWTVGAAANVLWSGVPVRNVVEELGGVSEGRRFMTSTGGDPLPKGIDPKTVIVERSVPLAVMENAMLAWEMNGEPVPVANGGPLRLIVPGYYGVNNIKYVKKVEFTERETDASIQASGYRVRPVGVKGAPDQPSMWEMKVKSWITHPLADARAGRVQIHGVAFGGFNAVERVEVTTDGGKSWSTGRFIGPDFGRFAWRPFVFAAKLSPGRHTIASRAADSKGNIQSEVTEPNERGYDYSGWKRLAVDVTVV
jgi:DMSO/TMAO reductase YedYZ molybdopterin-dependent catalytic subunit